MTSKLMFAAFGAALLIAACSPATAPPTGSRSPTATASSSPTPVVFSSTRYPYSITLPVGWVASPATTTWDGTGRLVSTDSTVDLFGPVGLGAAPGAAFGSAAPTTSLLAAWVADGIARTFGVKGDECPQKPDSVEPVTIGGQPGTLVASNCGGLLVNAAFTVANGYGYRFVLVDNTIPADIAPADHARFTTMLESVAFH